MSTKIEPVSPTRMVVRLGDHAVLVVDDLEGDDLAAAIAAESGAVLTTD